MSNSNPQKTTGFKILQKEKSKKICYLSLTCIWNFSSFCKNHYNPCSFVSAALQSVFTLYVFKGFLQHSLKVSANLFLCLGEMRCGNRAIKILKHHYYIPIWVMKQLRSKVNAIWCFFFFFKEITMSIFVPFVHAFLCWYTWIFLEMHSFVTTFFWLIYIIIIGWALYFAVILKFLSLSYITLNIG